MWLFRRLRFSMRTMTMLVLTAAAALALFAKIRQHAADIVAPGWSNDAPSLFLFAIGLTAVALGSWKEHTAVQVMLQMTLACVGCLILIQIGEARYERSIRYWFQATFAATVTLPLLARRFVKSELPRGPGRDWWKKSCEAVFFSFLNLMLAIVGGLLQIAISEIGSELMNSPMPYKFCFEPVPETSPFSLGGGRAPAWRP
jgi:hypothetical protein